MFRGLVLVSLLVACSGEKKAGDPAPSQTETGGAAGKGLTREQFLAVEIESECARLAADAEIDRLDEFREQALAKHGKTRLDRTSSLARYLDDATINGDIAAKTAECRRKAGWVEQPGPEGDPTWVRSSK
jgi:hypothetical protein